MDQHKPKKKQIKRLSETYLRNSALYYLQRHPTSVSHFITVMDRKMARSLRVHKDQDIAPFQAFVREVLVAEFSRAGFLNDELYARALAGTYRRKGLPERAVAMKLKMKGVEAPDAPEGHDDLAAGYIYARRKKLGPYATKVRDPQKDLAAMARAGFSYEVCKRVMDTSADDLPED